MRKVEWHELKANDIVVVTAVYPDEDVPMEFLLGVNSEGFIDEVDTVKQVITADQADNENNVLAIETGYTHIDKWLITAWESRGEVEITFYAFDQKESGKSASDVFEERFELPEEKFISTTTTKMEKMVSGGTPAIGEISCSPGVTCAVGNELNGRIIQRIELSEDRTIIELFDADGDLIVTIRPLEYTAFYLKPNQEG